MTVLLKGSGGAGLGDRLCGLAVAIAFSKATERTLVVDWRDRAFGSQAANLFPQLFRVQNLPHQSEMELDGEVVPGIWGGRLDLELDELRAVDLEQRGIRWTGEAPAWDRTEAIRRYSADVSTLDYKQDVVVIWSGSCMADLLEALRQRGDVPNDLTVDQLYRRSLCEHVGFAEDIEQSVTDVGGQFFGESPYLGVHYRKTEEAASARALPTESQYLAAVDRALTKMAEGTRIFLATDNRAVQDVFERRYGKDRVCWTSKWLPEQGRSIHKNAECPDGVQAAKDALLDVGLLARASRLVLTGNSSFSLMADWLSGKEGTDDIERVYPSTGSLPTRLARRLKRLLIPA